jgi:hypothetical protein
VVVVAQEGGWWDMELLAAGTAQQSPKPAAVGIEWGQDVTNRTALYKLKAALTYIHIIFLRRGRGAYIFFGEPDLGNVFRR